jgi:hypothetical protein
MQPGAEPYSACRLKSAAKELACQKYQSPPLSPSNPHANGYYEIACWPKTGLTSRQQASVSNIFPHSSR